ncbi:MAG: hypothetical protein LQ337_007140 [Flavoplaca oasis]|nr:MAG: hypothetical protein LQ337_007140 [Flavoplaca oasis]
MAKTTNSDVPQANQTSIPRYEVAYKEMTTSLLLDAVCYNAYLPREEEQDDYHKKLTKTVQEQAPSREEALSRVLRRLERLLGLVKLRAPMGFVDDIDTAIADADLLDRIARVVESPHEENAEKMGQFKVLHELINRRIADIQYMRAEGAVPKPSTEQEDGKEYCATGALED